MLITDINPSAKCEDGRLYSYSFIIYPDVKEVTKLHWTRAKPHVESDEKNLYFSHEDFSRECSYGKMKNCEVAIFHLNNKNNMHYFVNKDMFPKLKIVYMFSHPCGSQYNLTRMCKKIVIPLSFTDLWNVQYSTIPSISQNLFHGYKKDLKIYGMYSLDSKRIIHAVEHKLSWQDSIAKVHEELSYSPVGKHMKENKINFYEIANKNKQ